MSRASLYAPLDHVDAERWSRFGQGEEVLFPGLLGLVLEEVRVDYARMRLPAARHLHQAAGIVHGGAVASLLDSVVVPAIGASLPAGAEFSTVDLHVQYHRPLVGEAIAEGWVTRRGRRLVFCESEAIAVDTGKTIARAVMTYHVAPPAG